MNDLVEMRIANMVASGGNVVGWLMKQANKKREIAASFTRAAESYEARAYEEGAKVGEIGVDSLTVQSDDDNTVPLAGG